MTFSERPAEAAPVSANLFAVASPLWAYYGAAVATGIAVWSMTRIARTANIEAFLGASALAPAPDLASAPAALPSPVAASVNAPVLEVALRPVAEVAEPMVEIEAAVEAAPQPATEPVSDVVPHPVAEVAKLTPVSAPEVQVVADPVLEAGVEVDLEAPFESAPEPQTPAPLGVADVAADIAKSPAVRKGATNKPRPVET